MTTMLRLASLILMLSVLNCAPSKNNSKEEIAQATTISSKEMKDKGFSKGTITTNKSKDCPYILTVEQYKDKLDPINLNDFFKDNVPTEVWVTYSNLRMASRCNDARPVSITEIKKREE